MLVGWLVNSTTLAEMEEGLRKTYFQERSDVIDTVNGKRINYVRQDMMANVAELNTEVIIPIEETKKK
jgi:hypothetical protein